MTERDALNLTRKSPLKTTLPANVTIARCCDGKVRLERLKSSGVISARAWIAGRDVRKSTGCKTIPQAKLAATAWWQDLCVRVRKGETIGSPTFAHCAEKFLIFQDLRAARGLITPAQANNYRGRAAFWMPDLGRLRIAEMDAECLETIRETRARTRNKRGKPLTMAMIQKDFIFIMGVLRYAHAEMKTLTDVPQAPSFTGKFSVQKRGRPFLSAEEYQTLHHAAKAQCDDDGLNPRTKRQRQHLYWFILISVGGALRVGEAESVRWCDCEMKSLKMPNGTTQEAVRIMVLGKHSKGGAREEAYVLFGGVFAYKQMLGARSPEDAPDALLFPESNREGMKRLLKDVGLYEYRDPATGTTITRDRKSLRPTGITLRLDKGDNVSYRDIAKWARTSVQMVADFYDQATPESSAVKVATFKTSPAKTTP